MPIPTASSRWFLLLCAASIALCLPTLATAHAGNTPSTHDLLKASRPSEWHPLDPADTVYMDLPNGRVVIELAPHWAPAHVKNLKTLLREHYFDGTSVYRVQDNFVAQWGDPDSDHPAKAKSMGSARTTLPPEFTRRVDASLPFTTLPDGDVYAPVVGFSGDFPVGRDPETHQAWIAHCYGTVGVARDVAPRSGNGNTLYAVIGQARRIDRNLAVVGRVIEGMRHLSSLPRGPAPMGVYADAGKRVPISRMRLASQVPRAKRVHLEVLRTDSATFHRIVEAMRHRHDAFYRVSSGHVGLCALPLPVRRAHPSR